MVGIAEEPPRQLAPSVGSATLDFVIRAGSLVIDNIKIASDRLVRLGVIIFIITNERRLLRRCHS
jgi:hypothetical protein